jgi:predicted ribosomally synthesized peptide with nif11-like leader
VLTAAGFGARLERYTPLSAMSAEQLTAFWAAVEADECLQEKLKGARDADAAVAVAKEAGFDVSKADLLEYQAQQTLELSDEDLEKVAGGNFASAGDYRRFQYNPPPSYF